jgi:hypothetical protein
MQSEAKVRRRRERERSEKSHTDTKIDRADEKIPYTHAHNFFFSHRKRNKKRKYQRKKIFSLTSAHFFMFTNVSFYVEAISPSVRYKKK